PDPRHRRGNRYAPGRSDPQRAGQGAHGDEEGVPNGETPLRPSNLFPPPRAPEEPHAKGNHQKAHHLGIGAKPAIASPFRRPGGRPRRRTISAGAAQDDPLPTMIESLSFVMPMYNEIANIQRAIDDALRMGTTTLRDFEIIIVDDASTDGSGELVEQIARREPRLRILHHLRNRKLGASLRTGDLLPEI
ncbi:MAG: glycosyltransferase, partial [Chloroflexi bacterium]|nr:glycosyltransferase [Chloroflexota bacterium]